MDYMIDSCFPFKTVTRHTNDKPWITDNFRDLIRRRQRARKSGNHELANKLRNKVNRMAGRLRHNFYQSKVLSLGESSSRDWWKHMKTLMGGSTNGVSELQGLANQHTDGYLQELANTSEQFPGISLVVTCIS